VADRAYTIYRVRTKRRPWRSATLAVVLVVGALVGCAAWLARQEANHLPPGIEIEGVDVGGLSLAEARATLERTAATRAAQPVALLYEGGQLRTSGTELGAKANIDTVLAQAEDSRDRVSRLRSRLGLDDPITFELAYTVNPARLDVVLDRVEKEVEQRAMPARVALEGDEVVVTPARNGVQVDLQAAAAELAALPESVQLELLDVEPRISDADANAAREIAETLLNDAPPVVFEDRTYELPPGLVREAIRFRSGDGTIEVRLDPDPLEPALRRAFRQFEREPRDAGFRVEGKRVEVVPARRGIELAVGRTLASVVATPTAPEVRALFNDLKPELTTVAAQEYGIRQLVSEFTTPYSCCQGRVTNIQRAAEILDGYVIKPGGRFSLNEALGPRTAERGFVLAPMIAAGNRLENAIGGGVSQVATTFYNAAFFAGLELIEHTPHSFYISRYPMGREATVSWGGPELIFRNDWPVGILVKVEALDTSITVRFYSTKLRRRVETETGEPFNYVAATTVRVFNAALPSGSETVVQSGGISGFTVSYTRKVYRGKQLVKDETYTVRYFPENTIVEYGPKPSGGQQGGQGGGGSGADGEGAGAVGGAGGEGGGGGEEPPPQEPAPEPGEPPPPPT
jgi:vancomycin resistance protein YoaR